LEPDGFYIAHEVLHLVDICKLFLPSCSSSAKVTKHNFFIYQATLMWNVFPADSARSLNSKFLVWYSKVYFF